MSELTPGQERTRGRVEGLIAIAAPFLDVVLAAGERISRLAEPKDYEYYPIRAPESDESDATPASHEDPPPGPDGAG